LAQAGFINQAVYNYTFIADQSKKVTVGNMTFLYRKLKDNFLYNQAGIEDKNGVLTAQPMRAVADMLYFNPKYHFDFQDGIDWKKVKQIQKELGYQ